MVSLSSSVVKVLGLLLYLTLYFRHTAIRLSCHFHLVGPMWLILLNRLKQGAVSRGLPATAALKKALR